MKIKTYRLEGSALDWAVAKCERVDDYILYESFMTRWGDDEGDTYQYSTDWSQGGPIIEREGITVFCVDDYEWAASFGATQYFKNETPLSPTSLIAAMRCYVASRLGDEVDVPDELISEEVV